MKIKKCLKKTLCAAVMFALLLTAFPVLPVYAAEAEDDVFVGGLEPMHVIEVPDDAFEEASEIVSDTEADTFSVESKRLLAKYSWGDYAAPYAYSQMTESEKELYDKFASDGERLLNDEKIELIIYKGYYYTQTYNYTDLGLTKDQAVNVAWAFYTENPQYFFYKNDMLKNDKSVCLCVYPAFVSQQDRRTAIEAVASALAEAEETLDPQLAELSDDYEKEKKIEDYVVDRLTYESGVFSQSLYSCLVADGGAYKTVCAGYSKLFSVLCNHYGIETTVLGYSNSSDGHAWNKTQIDGKWYNVDTTWDDTTGQKYKYLNKSDAAYRADNHKTYLTSPYVSLYNTDWIPEAPEDYVPHTWDEGTVTVSPTCIKAGIKTLTCTDCGKTKTVEIPAAGHIPGAVVIENEVAPTHQKDGSYDEVIYCSVCEAELSRKTVIVGKLASLERAVVTLGKASGVYNGFDQKPQVTSVTLDGAILSENTDYVVNYLDENGKAVKNFTDAGTYTVKLVGAGEYADTETSVQFKIAKAPLSVSGLAFKTKYYDGSKYMMLESRYPVVDGVIGNDVVGVKTTRADYVITGTKSAGQKQRKLTAGLFEISGKDAGNYRIAEGTVAKGTIKKVSVSSVTLKTTAVSYTGTAQRPVISQITGNNGSRILQKNCTVTYKRNGVVTKDFTSRGQITVTVTGDTNWKGSKSVVYTIR